MDALLEFASRHLFMSILWVALLIILIAVWMRSAKQGYQVLSPQQATVWVNRGDGVFVDLRSTDEFRKGHIHGAKQVSAEQIKENQLGSIENFKDAPIVLVCATGMSAKASATQLLQQGYTQVAILEGGMNGWRSEKLPVTQK